MTNVSWDYPMVSAPNRNTLRKRSEDEKPVKDSKTDSDTKPAWIFFFTIEDVQCFSLTKLSSVAAITLLVHRHYYQF